jgi:hypothetical protein
MAENVTSTLHNIYTLRGAQVRDPLNWSKYIGEALYRFGLDAEVMFASHHWPRDNPDNDPCAVVWILNLGAGLDTRPYRMDLPRSLRFVEVDIRMSSI